MILSDFKSRFMGKIRAEQYFGYYFELKKENEELKQEIETLQEQIAYFDMGNVG